MMICVKTKGPCRTEVQQGQIGGWAFATRSFPMQPLGTRNAGRLLPDAILRDSRSCRPHSRAVQGLSALELLGEVYKPASANGCGH